MYYPKLDEFLKLAKEGNLVPVARRLLADIETPLSAYRKIRGPSESFLFESVEGGERLIPEPVQVGAQRAQPVRVELIEPAGTGLPVDHETGPFQHPQMLGDRGATHREPPGELDDRSRAGGQAFEDAPPGRVGKRRKCVLVSSHLR